MTIWDEIAHSLDIDAEGDAPFNLIEVDNVKEFRNRYVVQKASWVGGEPIPPDEPCLVIRGQDVLAVEMLREYIRRYEGIATSTRQRPLIMDLHRHLLALMEWQDANPGKVKVADR